MPAHLPSEPGAGHVEGSLSVIKDVKQKILSVKYFVPFDGFHCEGFCREVLTLF